MAKFQKVECVCGACGQSVWNGGQVSLPAGWGVECERCKTGTPGTPRKAVRHCATCREPIVVFGVSGGVRLICAKCAKHDDHLVPLEAAARDRDKARAQLNEVLRRTQFLEEERDKLQEEMGKRVQIATREIEQANKLLQTQVKDQEEDLLASRIQAAKRRQYADPDREVLTAFLSWLAVRGYWGCKDEGPILDQFLDSLEDEGG